MAFQRSASDKFIAAYDLYILIVMGLVKAAGTPDFPWLRHFCARGAGYAASHLSRVKRRQIEDGLKALELSKREKSLIAKRVFYVFWYDIFFGLSPCRTAKAAKCNSEVNGVEWLNSALERGHGVILWESSFFGRRMSAKRILHENGYSVHQVHAHDHVGGFHNSGSWIGKCIIQPLFDRFETRYVNEIIRLLGPDSFAFSRQFRVRLRQNCIVCIAADVSKGHKLVPIPFLGRTVYFPTGMVSLARLSGATILPLFCIQQKSGQTTVIIESPVPIEDGDDSSQKTVMHYARLLESYIKNYPEQYRYWDGLAALDNGKPYESATLS
jgi:lauroyl/myristoyl acyltransferase